MEPAPGEGTLEASGEGGREPQPAPAPTAPPNDPPGELSGGLPLAPAEYTDDTGVIVPPPPPLPLPWGFMVTT